MNDSTEGQMRAYAYILREEPTSNVAPLPLSIYDVSQSRNLIDQRSDTRIHAGIFNDKKTAEKVCAHYQSQYIPHTIRIGKWMAPSADFMPLLHTLIEVQQVWFESMNCVLGAPVRIFVQNGHLYLDMHLLKPAKGYESLFDARDHKMRLKRLFTSVTYKHVRTYASS